MEEASLQGERTNAACREKHEGKAEAPTLFEFSDALVQEAQLLPCLA